MIHRHPNPNTEFEVQEVGLGEDLSDGLTCFPGIPDREGRREGIDLGDAGR